MKLFKKKDNEEEKKIQNKGYRVIVKTKIGSTSKTVADFKAYRYLDEDENIDYLRNDQEKFLEVFPQDERLKTNLNIKEIEKKIKDLKEALKQEETIDNPNLNHKNMEFDLMKYEAILRSLTYGSDNVYSSISHDGLEEFIFLRIGTERIPLKWDLKTGTIYTADDNKKKSATLVLRNKKNKYSLNNKITATALILLFFGILLLVPNLWLLYKQWQGYDESKIADLETKNLQTLNYCGQVLRQSTEDLAETTKLVKSFVDENAKNKVQGFQPD